jgi:twitching motility two-component system response regulator PilH
MPTESPRVILVVDFDEEARRSTVELITQLARAGKHRVTLQSTTDGAEALRLINQAPPDLMITEALVPEVNGMELVRRLVERAGQDASPVIIVLSELSAEIDRFWALRNGAVEYLTKPCPPDLLRDRVLKFFSGSLGNDVSLDNWLT